MSHEVVTIPRDLSLRAAAHHLAQHGISGAPVVDEQGCCVGVLSMTDLVRWMDRGPQAARRVFQEPDCFCSDWAVVDLEVLPADCVARFMSNRVVSARPGTGVGELARGMLEAHVHRVIILDETGRPVGVVSTTDILAAVAAEDRR